MKFCKDYSEFMKSDAIYRLIEQTEKHVAGMSGVECACSLDFLKGSDNGAGFDAFYRLQKRFFDILDMIVSIGPESCIEKGFSFRDKSNPPHIVESNLVECLGAFSLNTYPWFVGLLSFWACIVRALVREGVGYGAGCPSKYKETDRLMSFYMSFTHTLVYGVGPHFPDKGRVVVDLDRVLFSALTFLSDGKPFCLLSPEEGFYLHIGPVGAAFCAPSRLEWLILRLVLIDFCFDGLLNLALRAGWDDLRSGGRVMVGSQYAGVKPFVELFSLFPGSVSRDERLFKTFYSLKALKSNRLSDEFKAALRKNDELVSRAKKLNTSRCPRDVAVFIDKHIRLSQMIYKKWSQNKKKFQLLEGKAAKREAFLKLFQGGVSPGDWEKSLFGDGGNFSGAVVDGLVSVLDQADFWRSRERSVGKIMGVFLLDKFHKNYASSRVQSWIAEIKAKKDRQDILNDMNL